MSKRLTFENGEVRDADAADVDDDVNQQEDPDDGDLLVNDEETEVSES
jgi:hypothetical protein